ncbi:MAG: acyl-CoA dehydrogenase family protein [Desulfobacterales bacterium]|nr:acyl-CoA dehydrogenase family protein [Desulfobacterales bacterium]
MSFPNRNNPYNFDEFLEWRKKVNYYDDDLFLKKVIKHFVKNEWEGLDKELKDFSHKVSYRWRDLSDSISMLEKKPYLVNYDAHHHRIDKLVRPIETEILEKEVFSEKIFSDKTSKWTKLCKMYLIYQNGEACVACPLTCTEGLVAILEQCSDSDETKEILTHCKEGIDGNFGIGSQYLSEIHGGSDVAANLLEAVKEGNNWKLYGSKFFCSAAHADYAVVTAKPKDSEKVGLFIVPAWLKDNKEKGIRNGYTIDRIKWKMGTSELPTAEITFNGSLGYQIGSLEKGLANVVGIVLTYSRLTVGLSSASSMKRVVREAKKYSELRSAFGLQIGQFPMLAGQLKEFEHFADRTLAGAFKLYSKFLKIQYPLKNIKDFDNSVESKQNKFNVRELIMLQKITAALDCTDVIRGAMSIFGGHGVMEDFSSIPRLFRDAVINELWEGPRNVLLTQIHRDFQKIAEFYKPEEFIKNILKGHDEGNIKELSQEAKELVMYPSLYNMDDKTIKICGQWDKFCHKLFHAYQDLAMMEVTNK